MFNVVPYIFYYGGRVEKDVPTRGELARAYAAAVGILTGSGSEQRAFWARISWSFLVSGVMPVLGHWLFDWPVALVALAIGLDVTALWLADLVRAVLARDAFQVLARRQLATENVLMMARAMLNYRRHPARGVRSHRVVEADHPWLLFLMLYVGCYGVLVLMYATTLLIFVLLYPDLGVDHASLYWLAVPAAIRIATALRDATMGNDGRLDVQMQPQALLPIGALVGATLLAAWSVLGLQDEEGLRDAIESYYGLLFLVAYLVCAVSLALLSVRRLRHAEADLRRFTAIDVDQWQDRLSRAA